MRAILFILCCCIALFCQAQPSETQIKKDVGIAGTLSFRFTKPTGTRQWNDDIKNWEYVRGVEVVRNSEFPSIKLIVAGDAVYQYTGNGGYSYWKFRTLSNKYKGIPDPSEAEVLALIQKNPAQFFGNHFFKIVTLIEKPHLSETPNWIWNKPTSVQFKMKAKYEVIVSNIETETVEQTFDVRLYRADLHGEWKQWNAFPSRLASEKQSFGKKNYPAEVLAKKSTLHFTYAEAAEKPTVSLNLPTFGTFRELVMTLHQTLREGSPEQAKTLLINTLAPRFFVSNSKTQLTNEGQELIKQVLDKVYQHAVTYKMLYCPKPSINNGLSSDKALNLLSSVREVGTMIEGDLYTEGYSDGKPIQSWKIHRIAIGMRYDDNVLKFLQSFNDAKKLCSN
ncbi:MAG: hypothetical protein U0Y10_16250 [Spirosomataceae bacterium]